MSRPKAPPKRHCRECGCEVYSWTEAPLCKVCVGATVAIRPEESLREFRRRIMLEREQ